MVGKEGQEAGRTPRPIPGRVESICMDGVKIPGWWLFDGRR
jgi:hypothetical protein